MYSFFIRPGREQCRGGYEEPLMAVAVKLKRYLDNKRVIYDVYELRPFSSLLQAAESAEVHPSAVAKTIMLKDELGLVAVVMPATHSLDAPALSKMLSRRLELASEEQIRSVFRDCDPRFVPSLGDAYGVRTILDEALLTPESIFFPVGDNARLIAVSNKNFFNLLNRAWLAGNFSRPLGGHESQVEGGAVQTGFGSAAELERRIREVHHLPPMPDLARRIFALRADPSANADKLGKIVDVDPSLAAQVMRYARSPFYAYQGKVDSVQTAISRVLGFEMVMNLALGIAAARPFKIPAIGPLGLNNFWRHATYSAALVQTLGRELPAARRLPAGMCYLAGLLHNFGHLLLGHLFKREFCVLSNLIGEHPEVPVVEQELATLGVDHGQLGAWLMDAWNMPEEIVVAVREHHNEDYNGPHADYARLVLIADRMLKEHGLGDAPSAEMPPQVLAALDIEEVHTVMVMGRLLEGCEDLNAMARQLAA